MTQLPSAANAVLDDEKIEKYLLNPKHPIGSGKARFFESCGFAAIRWRELRDALLAHARDNLLAGQVTNRYGTKYESPVICELRMGAIHASSRSGSWKPAALSLAS